VRWCDAECDEEECKIEDATMLEEGTKHDQIRRHDNEFDKTTRVIRVDAFKKNAGGHAQECAQLALERGAPHSIVRADRCALRS
jgi:hypothetical protein